MQLAVLDFLVILAYLVGLSALGVYFSRRQSSEDSYFLGNRRMPWVLVGVSVMATLVSTLSYLSLPGEMIKHGVGYFASLLSFVFVIPLVNRLIIPALMRLPVTSVYEYFERRYHVGVRLLGATVFIVMRLTWVGLIIYTASFAVAKMTGWPTPWVILIVGIVTTAYTTAGGMQAVIWSDFIQGLLLVGGAALIPLLIALKTQAGPLLWWQTFAEAGRADVPIFSLDPFVRISMVGMVIEAFLWHACTHSADQVATQRYFSTASVDAARRSFWVSALFTVVLLGLLMVVGLAVFFFYYQRSGLPVQAFQQQIAADADAALPQFIARELPAGLSGLLLAALLAAAMSSLSSGINSIASVVMSDFVERLGGRSRRGVRPAMAVALSAGVVGVVMALGVDCYMRAQSHWNLVELVERINHLFVAPLGALFLSGLLFRRVGAGAAVAGFIAGVATSMLISFSREIFGLSEGISFMWIMPGAFVASMFVSLATGFLLPPPGPEQVAALTARR
ncbi:MAG: sodium/solute symporter [Rhodopirellula sp.]|nr:sodium/solute symporter [Rhodopirellula sp.]